MVMIRFFLLILISTMACLPKSAVPVSDAPEGVVSLSPPQAEDFMFGPGDVIDIKMWRHDDMNMEVVIAPDGVITYPLIGRIKVSGLTYPQLLKRMEKALSRYYKDPSLAVNVVKISNQKVFVLGEVRNPAVLQIENDLSVVEALTRTGGISADAKTSNLLLIRGGIDEPILLTIDIADLFSKGDLTQNIYLQRGDILLVPVKTIVHVERFFRRAQGVLAPFLSGSALYRNVSGPGAQGTSSGLE
jgi:polysaccharide export outer membrane protein